jgi:GH15 family glucan-1,4-alpha-glucosidase
VSDRRSRPLANADEPVVSSIARIGRSDERSRSGRRWDTSAATNAGLDLTGSSGANMTHLPPPGGELRSLRDDPTTCELLEEIFPPIADYAFLSDCENTCLVAPTGAVEWLCLPLPHDPSVFGTILDRSAGSFRLAPVDAAVPVNRRYVPGTMVLATTWQTRNGWLSVRDFLEVGPWHRLSDRPLLHRRPPSDYDAHHRLVRIATCLKGSVEIEVNCEPSFDYGRSDATWEYPADYYGRVITTNPGFPRLMLSTDLRLGIDGRAAKARHRLGEGESCFVVLGWSDDQERVDTDDVPKSLAETNRFWREWIDGGRFPDHPWREHLQRSALTLKALTYLPPGALLAAPTTSLPEHVGGKRNWDYRFTWVRDGSFTLWALAALGFDAEADDFLAFLGDVLEPDGQADSSGPRVLQVLYGVDGKREVPERQLDHLGGYAGSRPVRVGNAAFNQDQFDILGAIVDSVYQRTRTRDALDERSWRVVVHAVEIAARRWRDPDQSIWEMRGAARHYTYSKVMCWVALDRGSRLAALRGESVLAQRWWQIALEIHADALAHGVDEKGRFVQSYGSNELDASLLLLPLMRFLPPDDERIRATVLAIADELTNDGFVRRYRPESTDDGLDDPEATFTVCSFWLVSALTEIGETERARKLCERLLGSASGLGLYGEELDPVTGRHLGNFPQALTHLALINAVLHVIETENRRDTWQLATVASPTWWSAAR